MPRADRLFALVQLLSGPMRRTLDGLAHELRASPRTIYRDMADLEARGVAIERAGGRYRLVEGSVVRPLPLTDRERILLTIALDNPDLERQPAWRADRRERLVVRSLLSQRRPAPAFPMAGPRSSKAGVSTPRPRLTMCSSWMWQRPHLLEPSPNRKYGNIAR